MKFVLFDFHLPFLFLLSLCLFPLVIANDMGERARAGHQARALSVSCFQGNGAGLLFYHHLGFVPYGLEERQDWFGYPMALIHLRLNL